MTEHDWMNEDEIRRILGADPDPSLTAEQRRAIVRRVRAVEEAALDRVLGSVEVELPEGLADRVRARSFGRHISCRLVPPRDVAPGVKISLASAHITK